MSCKIRREQDEFICTKCSRRWPVGEAIDCVKPIGRDVPFSEQEAVLFNFLRVDQDTAIAALFRAMDGRNTIVDPQEQQQRVGAVISRINRKLFEHSYEVVPGVARRTYRLQRLA